MKLIIIDLFCGAGGVTTGFELADDCKVIACINHDEIAIESHLANHPDVIHFTEDIKHIQMQQLKDIADRAHAEYPDAALLLWASLECTNFSKAKGGLPRDADSRSLADNLPWYVESLKPDYIGIENVIEFMSWVPLDENGKPISRQSGCDYLRWVDTMKQLNTGYDYDWKQLNSADYGAFTSRKRFFALFNAPGFPVAWPKQTHAKNPEKVIGQNLSKWKAVREVLDLEDKGESIFTRKKPLSEKTLERIYAGLIKFVAGGKDAWLLKYNSINGKTGVHHPPSVDEPCPVIAVQSRLGLVQPQFVARYFSGKPEGKVNSINDPSGTLLTHPQSALVSCEYLVQYNGKPNNSEFATDKPIGTLCSKDRFAKVNCDFMLNYHHSSKHDSIDKPNPALTTKDRHALICPQFIYRDFSNGGEKKSIDEPGGSILAIPKMNLVTCEPFIMDTQFNNTVASINDPAKVITANRKWHYLINPQWFNTNTTGIDEPCYTLIARMDKTPPYLITVEDGKLAIEVYETDSEFTVKIKEFMALYGIYDIKMRMLRVLELLKIQGFPDGYILKGNQAQQKKFIGNSVVPLVIKCWAEALCKSLTDPELNVA